MNNNELLPRRVFARLNHYQQVLLAQLPSVIQHSEHIDELLQWLGSACEQQFGVQIAQFWVHHRQIQRGRSSLKLRLMVFRYPAFPQQTVVNSHVAAVVERVMRDRYGVMPQQAELLLAHRL